MGKKKNTSQTEVVDLEVENRRLNDKVIALQQSIRADRFASMINSLIRWGGAVMLARYGYLAVDALAGHQTSADIGIKVLGNVRISDSLAWLVGGSGIAYGGLQTKLRRDTIKSLGKHNKALEARIDPGRTSSDLNEMGEVPVEDIN